MAANQVARAPPINPAMGFSGLPSKMAIRQPAAAAIFAAANLVTIPPEAKSLPALPAMASISGVIRATRSRWRAAGSRLGSLE